MNILHQLYRQLLRTRSIGFGVLAWSSLAFAQQTPAANDKTPADQPATSAVQGKTAEQEAENSEAPPIELSPFVVSASRNGYFASNTMSGTRLNSKIEDLGASVTVVTKQQLLDTASVDINDVFQYEANTMGTNQYTDTSVDFQGRVVDNVQASPYTTNLVRGLTSANIAVNGFSSTSSIPFDAYNIDSLEISRGANSTLAGLGNVGGTLNVNQSSADVHRQSTGVQTRGDSFGGYRISATFNQPIVSEKLAIAGALLYDSKGFKQKPSADIQRRAYVALMYKPLSSTSLSASFERYSEFRRTPNAITPTDMVSEWANNGMPTWDPVTYTAHLNGQSFQVAQNVENNLPTNPVASQRGLPIGLGRDSFFDNYPSLFIQPNGTVALFTPNRLQASGAPGTANWTSNERLMTSYSMVARQRNVGTGSLYPLDSLVGVSNRNIYDYEKINIVAPNFVVDNAKSYQLRLDQKLFETPMQQAYAQVAWRLEKLDDYNHTELDNTTNIYIDVNERLLDGQPNPFFLRPYVNAIQKSFIDRKTDNDTVRAQLTYALDLRQAHSIWLSWLGRHQFGGYYERNANTVSSYNYRQAVTTPEPWIVPSNIYNGHGNTTDRYYVGDATGHNVDYAPAIWDMNSLTVPYYYAPNVSTAAGALNSFSSALVNLDGHVFGGVTRTRTNLDTRGGTTQSFFWNNRLVTTLGLREDFEKFRSNTPVVFDSTTGVATMSNYNSWGPWTRVGGRTYTLQGVLRPLANWQFNQSALTNGGIGGFFARLIEGFQLQYSYADSFLPAGPAVNLFDEPLGNPKGTTRDYGFSVNLGEKLVARVNWYNATQIGARLQQQYSIPVIILRQLEVAATNSFTAADTNTFEGFARGIIQNQMPSADSATKEAALYKLVQMPTGYFDGMRSVPGGITGVTDMNNTTSKGVEIELNYNPTKNFRLKLTAAKSDVRDSALIDSTRQFISQQMPLWTTLTDPNRTLANGQANPNYGKVWFGGASTSAAALYNAQVLNNIKLFDANLGKQRLQTPEWSGALIADYSFAYGKLKGFSVGSAVRWQDKQSLGFFGIPNASGVYDQYDINRPVFQPAVTTYDFFTGYRFKLFHGKVSGNVQINCKNAFGHNGLTAVRFNPEGYPAQFRIKFGQEWFLTTSFDL